MKPAFSVVFFTVVSGAGAGLLALLGLAVALGLPWVTPDALPRVAAAGLALTAAGLCASTLHLANPRNAWRSFTRFRYSWLSREAVFAVALLVVSTLFLARLVQGGDGAARALLALLTTALAWTVLVCTAMIYGSLKPIRQWHTRWTPVTYFVLGHWSGGLVLFAFARYAAADSAWLGPLCLALAVAAALVKAGYWRTIRAATDAITLEQAIGVAEGVRPPAAVGAPSVMQARLFDAGHAPRTFLTDEFGFRLARRHRAMLLAAFWSVGIALPFVWVAGGWGSAPALVGACVANLVGTLAERTLFFADARHTVRLYHGEPRT